MRFQAPDSRPITELDSDIVCEEFEDIPKHVIDYALNALFGHSIANNIQQPNQMAAPSSRKKRKANGDHTSEGSPVKRSQNCF